MPGADLLEVATSGLVGLLALLAVIGCAVTFAALASVARYGRRPSAPALLAYPSVTVLKPLYGEEPGLSDNLASFCDQDYPAPVEVVFGLQRADDPALAVARAVAARHPQARVRIVVDERRWGQNGKVSNLINMERAGGHDVVVLADSDMRVGRDYLRQVAAALGTPGVGLVTCLYRGAALPSLWSRLTAIGIDISFLPNVILGLTLGLAKPCFGSTIALRRDTLRRIGGFAAFRDVLADDNAMGQAVRRLGLAVAVPARPVLDHLCAATTARATFAQDLRWSRTIRSVDPGGFAGSIVTNPLPFAAIAWLFDGFGWRTLALLVVTLACRAALQQRMAQFTGAASHPLWLGPLRDCWSFAVFVASFWPGSLDWRGHTFAVEADGTMAPPGHTGS